MFLLGTGLMPLSYIQECDKKYHRERSWQENDRSLMHSHFCWTCRTSLSPRSLLNLTITVLHLSQWQEKAGVEERLGAVGVSPTRAQAPREISWSMRKLLTKIVHSEIFFVRLLYVYKGSYAGCSGHNAHNHPSFMLAWLALELRIR